MSISFLILLNIVYELKVANRTKYDIIRTMKNIVNLIKGEKMDIKFDTEDYRFNVRSSCIIKDPNHKYVILTNMRGIKTHEAFQLPGGRIEIMENSEEGVIREIQEELGITVNCKLVSVEENYNKAINFHMIEFVYYAEIDNLKEIVKKQEDDWDKFKVIEIEKINEYDIRPSHVKKLIKMEEYSNIYHSINYDWGNE